MFIYIGLPFLDNKNVFTNTDYSNISVIEVSLNQQATKSYTPKFELKFKENAIKNHLGTRKVRNMSTTNY